MSWIIDAIIEAILIGITVKIIRIFYPDLNVFILFFIAASIASIIYYSIKFLINRT